MKRLLLIILAFVSITFASAATVTPTICGVVNGVPTLFTSIVGGNATEMPAIDMTTIPVADPTKVFSIPRIQKDPRPWLTPPRVNAGGEFRVVLNYGKFLFDDPIVWHNSPGQAHGHVFFGNMDINANSNLDDLGNCTKSTSAGGTANCSSYWMPAMIDTTGSIFDALFKPIPKQVIKPIGAVAYYKTTASGVPFVERLPKGLRFIAGNSTATTANNTKGMLLRYECVGGTSPNTVSSTIQQCASDKTVMRIMMNAPQCWDGVHLDTNDKDFAINDHQSHMAYRDEEHQALKAAFVASGGKRSYWFASPLKPTASELAAFNAKGFSSIFFANPNLPTTAELDAMQYIGYYFADPVNPTKAELDYFVKARATGCEAKHPVMIPDITLNVDYAVTTNMSNWRLASDNYQGGSGGASGHFDYAEGWSTIPVLDTTVNAFVGTKYGIKATNYNAFDVMFNNCLKLREDCSANLLGDAITHSMLY